jgi:hypothetical protein
MGRKPNININADGKMAYLSFKNVAAAAVTVSNSSNILNTPDATPIKMKIDNKQYRGVVPWGADNDLPQQIISKVRMSPDMSTNMLFNISAGYGEGILPVKFVIDKETGNKTVIPCSPDDDTYSSMFEFFENNNLNRYLLEQFTDLNYFYNVFPEIILNREPSASRKVVELNHKEATFSRWEVLNPATGEIENHFYSAGWDQSVKSDVNNADIAKTLSENPTNTTAFTVTPTPVLRATNPVLDLKRRIGREPGLDGKTNDEQQYRYIIPINFPTPGKTYYTEPYWYSLILSGWYDFAIAIPSFKKAILNNQMTIKYMVYINEKYWDKVFKSEGLTEPKKQKERMAAEYVNIQTFLAGAENSGKATISEIRYTPDGKEEPMIKIVPIENNFKGGEYLEDSEEAANILAYGMDVHGSMIGSHGKSKTINGTEARELFILKQARLKPIRDMLLYPLYLIKAINQWPKEVQFVIPNMELTTLDKGTGAQKVIGSDKL